MYYRWFYSTFDEFTFISLKNIQKLKRTCSDALICEKLPFLLTQLPICAKEMWQLPISY